MDDRSSLSRADLHVHSEASQESRLGVQRALGLPECATPPEEAYDLAKRRGMDFVTLTDHDTIAGALLLAERHDDAFVSEELTTWFRGEPQAVHVLCLGITPDDHDRLQARAADVEAVAEYLHEHEIACALAHPFYAVTAPLTPRHRRRLAQLFPVWETRNGSRAPELNSPAAVYIDTHGGIGIGGTDDHAGVDIGRTYTETPRADDAEAFLANVRTGLATARGEQGSAARWTHAAMALTIRALGRGDDSGPAPDPMAVLRMVERVVSEGDRRGGVAGARPRPGGRTRAAAGVAALRRARRRPRARAPGDPPGRGLPPRSAGPQGPALPRACAAPRRRRRGRPRGRRRRIAARRGRGGVRGLRPGHPVRPGVGVPGTREGAARAARGRAARRPRRRRPRRRARRDTDDRRAARARRPRMGRRGDRHGCRGGPEAQRGDRGRGALVPGPGDRRPVAAGGRRRAGGRPLRRRARDGPGPRRGDGRGARADHGRCRSSRASTPSSPSTPACAPATRASRRPRRWRSAVFYGAADHVLSPSPAADATLRALGIDDDRIGRWDRGVDSRPVRPPPPGAGPAARRAHRPLRGEVHAREGGRPAGRRVPGRARARSRAAPRARGRRSRGGGAARSPRRARDLPRLAGGRRPRPRLRQRRHLPLPEPHRHVRPGRPRGPGERTAGDRGRRGRPGDARARRRHGPAAPLGPRRARGGGRSGWPPTSGPASASPAPGWPRSPTARGSARSRGWPTAT